MFKFKPIIQRNRKQQKFDINFKIKQKGKEFNLYDSIQQAREDTELYTVLEKYGMVPKHCLDLGKVYADFRELGSLADMKMQQIKADEMWNALPADVRKEFNNDKYLFAKDGENYIKKKLDAQAPKMPVEPQNVVSGGGVAESTTTNTGGVL